MELVSAELVVHPDWLIQRRLHILSCLVGVSEESVVMELELHSV